MELLEKNLKERWAELLANQPKLRIRNAAEILQTTEIELLATKSESDVIFLKPDFISILKSIGDLGEVMALTRNDSVVHEVKGEYDHPSFNGPAVGMFLGEWIDLRIFFSVWKYALSVNEKERKSIQFFDKYGKAIHKIYLTEKSNHEAYTAIIDQFRIADRKVEISTPPTPPAFEDPKNITLAEFQQGWLDMKDTHEFFGLVQRFNLSRQDALRNAPPGEYALRIDNAALTDLLQTCAEQNVPIMSFVGNHGIIQIFSGEIHRVVAVENWLNILDPRFNLHINSSALHEIYIVRKPSVDGIVTSIECFDNCEELIVQFFGKRKPGIPELEGWRNIVREIQNEYTL